MKTKPKIKAVNQSNLSAGQITLLKFINSHESVKNIVGENNLELLRSLIPKGYEKHELSKGFEEAFLLPCELDSLKIDNLINS